MTRSHWQARAGQVHRRADVVVVGAGIAGASTAYWLKRLSPSLRIVIVDQLEPAVGASGRNAGFLLQGHATSFAQDVDRLGPDRASQFWDFTLENRNLIFGEFEASDLALRATGSVTAAGSPEEADALARSARLLAAAGRDVSYLDDSETARVTASKGFFGGLHVATGAVVDPVRLVNAVVHQSGVEVHAGIRVRAVEPSASGCKVIADGVTYVAPRVVVAVNAASGRLLPEFAGTVRPIRAQMLATDPLPHHLAVPVYSHEGYFYVRQLQSGQVLVGGARHVHREAEMGYEDATTVGLQEDLSSYLRTHFPWTTDHVVAERWSGTMAFTNDKLPRVGTIRGIGSAIWIGGFSGHGMSMAFLTGKVVAELLLDVGRHPILDLLEHA